jgi:DNA-binding LacI/PurR family transcriptional regulator
VVRIAEEVAFQEATSHLIRLGHKAIGHISASLKISQFWRMNGYRRALDAHRITFDERWVCDTEDITIEAGYRAAMRLLDQAPEVTAISCFNDLIAVGVLRACAKLGRHVPQDVAITGFDDIELASLVSPRLTTIRVPRYRVGEELMKGLLRMIATDGAEQPHVTIDLELVVRESCGAVER